MELASIYSYIRVIMESVLESVQFFFSYVVLHRAGKRHECGHCHLRSLENVTWQCCAWMFTSRGMLSGQVSIRDASRDQEQQSPGVMEMTEGRFFSSAVACKACYSKGRTSGFPCSKWYCLSAKHSSYVTTFPSNPKYVIISHQGEHNLG